MTLQMCRARRLRAGTIIGIFLLVPMFAAGIARATVFKYTGTEQEFRAPAGATMVHILLIGGRGEEVVRHGGYGAKVEADVPVGTSTLWVEVGGDGSASQKGFNGGGESQSGRDGGGATDIRTVSVGHDKTESLNSRLAVAGGGGAGGNEAGGGNAGQNAESFPTLGGEAGSSTKGGLGAEGIFPIGFKGFNGSLGQGGSALGSAGGGGGGYYGGGGGGGLEFSFPEIRQTGGGGGGSNLLVPGSVNVAEGLAVGEAAEAAITAPIPETSTPPTIGGEAVAGVTLSESHAGWANSPTGYEYQWERCTPHCGAIPGATGPTYQLKKADVGSTIRVQETARNLYGSARADSATTSEVKAPLPVAQKPPVVSGEPVAGAILTESGGEWINAPTEFSYQWERCNPGCTPVPGATGKTYQLGKADVGATIRVEETATNIYGSGHADSATTPETAAPIPTASRSPVVTGETVVGDTLSAGRGEWSNEPAGYAFQWERCTPACAAIPGATSQTYGLNGSDVDARIRVQVQATNSYGTGSAVSAPTGTIVARTPPVSTSPPVIAGIPLRGQPLSASLGSWANSPSAYAFQWQRCSATGGSCTNLSGIASSTYAPTQSDVGETLRVVVTASNIYGSSVSQSAVTSIVGSQIESSMSWKFGAARRYTIVEELAVHGLPLGAAIEISCHGLGCPFGLAHVARRHKRHHARAHSPRAGGEVSLSGKFAGSRLTVGDRMTVSITKPHWLEKEFMFTMRPRQQPRVRIVCVAPGGRQTSC